MIWHVIDFGKFKNKGYSIPELAWKQPSYFSWCIKNAVFKGEALDQAELAGCNLTNLRLPQNLRGTHCIQFLYDWQGKLSDVRVTELHRLGMIPANNEIRSETINLVWKTDGIGRKLILKAFKKHWLNERSLTKKRLEELLSEER